MAKRIDVEDVNVYYSEFLAIEGASIKIAPLSVTAFIGPSGCGKSTFLRILNRMHEVIPGGRVSGKVLLDGEDLYGPGVDPVNVRRTVGMVFQKANPFPTMSIYDNVIAGYKIAGSRKTRSSLSASRASLSASPNTPSVLSRVMVRYIRTMAGTYLKNFQPVVFSRTISSPATPATTPIMSSPSVITGAS